MSGNLRTARVYDARSGEFDENGASPAALILVDRLWPRGVKKTDLSLAGWPKELTPSPQLRRDFHSSVLDWEAFTAAYQEELGDRLGNEELDSALRLIRDLLENGDVVLLYAGKDTKHSHAVVLRDWLSGVLSTQ